MSKLWMLGMTVVVWSVLFLAAAQTLSGQYFYPTDVGGITLILEQDAAGNIRGSISGNGVSFALSGQLAPQQAGAAFGIASLEGQQSAFEIYSQDGQLALYLFDYLPDGNLDIANATEIVFERSLGQTPPVSSPNTPTPTTSNPLLPPSTSSTPPNPLAPVAVADPFAGSYSGTDLKLELSGQNPYSGTLTFQGQQYPIQASAMAMRLQGSFTANGSNFPFEAELQGANLSFTTAGVSYSLVKQALTANPLAPANPPTPSNPLQPATIAAPATATAGQGQLIGLDQQYAAGTTVVSPSSGVSITIPPGYKAAFDPSSDAFTLVADDQTHAFAIVSFSKATALELGTYAVSEAQDENTQLITTIPVQQTNNSISAGYQLTSEQGQLAVYVSAKDSPAGNAVVVGAASVVKGEQELQSLTSSLMQGISLAAPESSQADQYSAALAGKLLTRVGTQSHYSPGVGAGDYASSAGQNKEHYVFCSDGSYSYDYESEFFFSSDAGSVSNTETDQHQGSWRLGMNIIGYPAMVLTASDGRVFVHPLAETAEGVAVGDGVFQLSASNQCL